MTGKRCLKILAAAILVTVVSAAAVVFLYMGVSGGADKAAVSPVPAQKSDAGSLNDSMLQEYQSQNEDLRDHIRIKFTDVGTVLENMWEGYYILLPESMSGTIEYGSTGIGVDCDDSNFDIYFEKFNSPEEVESYLSYSNKFIENSGDHKEGTVENYKLGDKEIQITQWSRERLQRIDGDRNYYICADV
ncbi:MAG: hypothetical protein Q4C14_04195, partial [Bacillota bacterium]|nr:hypothetical protein [Bacillota bacterium]